MAALGSGHGHRLVRGGGLPEGAGQLLHLFGQGDAGGVVARAFGGLAQAVSEAIGTEHDAAHGAQAAPGVGAQLQPQAPEAASVVVGLVQQVAHAQPGLVLAAVQVHAALAGRVVQHELVGAVATKLFALDAAQCGGVGLAVLARLGRPGGTSVPGGAVATRAAGDAVALGAGAVVGGVGQNGSV